MEEKEDRAEWAPDSDKGPSGDAAARTGQDPAMEPVAAEGDRRPEDGSAEEAFSFEDFDVILASGSPRRRQLLEDAGVEFTVRVSEVDETLEPDLMNNPEEAVKKLAERKAGAVIQEILAEDYTGLGMVLGADTMVVLGDRIFGKPRTASEAKEMLRALSGRTHEVKTAVSVWCVMAPEIEKLSLGFRTFVETSYVTFRELDDEAIDAYVETGEPFDKAGAYGIQGEGIRLVERHEGDFDNIVGLPVSRLLETFPELRRR